MKQQISPGIVAGAVIVMVLLIGIAAYMVFGKSGKTEDTRASDPRYKAYMAGGSGSGGRPPGSPSSSGSPNSGGMSGSGGSPSSGGMSGSGGR